MNLFVIYLKIGEEKEQILTALQGLENTNTLCENELLTKLSAVFKMKNTNWIEVDFSSWKKDLRAEKIFQDLFSAGTLQLENLR